MEGAAGSSGVAEWKPSGIPAAGVERPCALVSSSFLSRLSLGEYRAPPVMFAKRKGIPVEGRDFSKERGILRPMPTPEDQARAHIDQALEQAGWRVQDYKGANLRAGRGVVFETFHSKAVTALRTICCIWMEKPLG